jgi:hypothetical protein
MHLELNQVHGLILGLVFQVGGFGLSGTRVMSSNRTRFTNQILDPLPTPVCFASIAWQFFEIQVLGPSYPYPLSQLQSPSQSPMTDKLDGEDSLFGVTSSEDEVVGPKRPAPRRPRDHSPVSVRYVASQVRGQDGRHQQTQLCLIRDCPYPARVWQNFRFCSRTCGRLVRGSFWFGAWQLTHPFVCWFIAYQRRGIPD